MITFKDKLRHAFAVRSTPLESCDELPEALEKVARAVVERGMETPAIIFLESVVPLSFLGSQAMHAVWPLVKMASVSGGVGFEEIASSLEDRETVRRFARKIEELAAERQGV